MIYGSLLDLHLSVQCKHYIPIGIGLVQLHLHLQLGCLWRGG